MNLIAGARHHALRLHHFAAYSAAWCGLIALMLAALAVALEAAIPASRPGADLMFGNKGRIADVPYVLAWGRLGSATVYFCRSTSTI